MNSLYEPFQSSYRAVHSTETALLHMVNNFLFELDKQNTAALLVLLDTSVASNTVDHRILFKRLEHTFGITGESCQWFKSYLSDRSVCLNQIDCSVPHGSTHFLLLLYHCYADNTGQISSFVVRPAANRNGPYVLYRMYRGLDIQ